MGMTVQIGMVENQSGDHCTGPSMGRALNHSTSELTLSIFIYIKHCTIHSPAEGFVSSTGSRNTSTNVAESA